MNNMNTKINLNAKYSPLALVFGFVVKNTHKLRHCLIISFVAFEHIISLAFLSLSKWFEE